MTQIRMTRGNGRVLSRIMEVETQMERLLAQDEAGVMPVFNVRTMYGAGPDRTESYNNSALQSAVDDMNAAGGGIVYVPEAPSHYPIDTPIVLRSDVHIVGGGYNAHIRNTRASVLTAGDTAVLLPGNYSNPSLGFGFTDETYYPVSDVSIGDIFLDFDNANDEQNFTAGDIVFVASVTKDGIGNPIRHEMNECVEVDDANNRIYLKYPMGTEITTGDHGGVEVARSSGTLTDSFGNSVSVAARASISNLRVSQVAETAQNSGLIRYGGSWECAFRDIWANGESGWLLNGMARSLFSNLTVNVYENALEFAYFSNHSIVENSRFTQMVAANSVDQWTVGFNNDSNGHIFRNNHVSNGRVSSTTYGALQLAGSRDMIVEGNFLWAPNGSGPVVRVGGRCDGLTLRDNRIYCVAGNAYGIWVSDASTSNNDILIDGNRIYGTPANSYGIYVDRLSDGVRIVNNTLPDSNIVIDSTKVSATYIRGNKTAQTNESSHYHEYDGTQYTGSAVPFAYEKAAGVPSPYSVYKVRVTGEVSNDAGSSNNIVVRIQFQAVGTADHNVASIAYAPGESGEFELEAVLEFRGALTAQFFRGLENKGGTLTTSIGTATENIGTDIMRLRLNIAYQTSTTGTVDVYTWEVEALDEFDRA